MPKRRDVSPEELNSIIGLQQTKTSWLQIQHKTGVPRQIAKRAYQNWERSRLHGELTQARIQVATNLLNEHLEQLVQLAQALVHFVPDSIGLLEDRDAETILNGLWTSYVPVRADTPLSALAFYPLSERSHRLIVRNHRVLLRSLQDHTRERMDWQIMDNWKESWNNCRRSMNELRSKAEDTVSNILRHPEQDVGARVMELEDGEGVIKNMAAGVVEVLWRGMESNTLEMIIGLVRIKPTTAGTAVIRFGESGSLTTIELNDVRLAETVAHICQWATKNLYIEEEHGCIKQYRDNIRGIREAVEKLEEALNPFTLRSTIIKTKCDQCPA